MVQTVLEKFGRINIFVNSAGLIDLAPITEANPQRWQELIQVNSLGTMYCCHAVAPVMMQQQQCYRELAKVLDRLSSPLLSG